MQVATHSGPMHADDVFALATMRMAFPCAIQVVRTRDPQLLAESDFRVDVGGKHDPETHDFDHHQRDFQGLRANGKKRSGFGLIWQQFGGALCGDQEVAQIVDDSLVAQIDASDNGEADTHGFGLSHAVHQFNPSWDQPQDFDSAFHLAVQFAVGVLGRAIDEAASIVRSRETWRAALAKANGEIMLLDKFCPWSSDAQFFVEAPASLKFVVFENPDGTWMCQAIPPTLGSFAQRLPLSEHLAGLRDEALCEASEIPDAVFVHPGRFIGGAKSLVGARRLAEIALFESWTEVVA